MQFVHLGKLKWKHVFTLNIGTRPAFLQIASTEPMSWLTITRRSWFCSMYVHSQEFIESIQPFLSSPYTDKHFTIFFLVSDEIENLSLLTIGRQMCSSCQLLYYFVYHAFFHSAWWMTFLSSLLGVEIGYTIHLFIYGLVFNCTTHLCRLYQISATWLHLWDYKHYGAWGLDVLIAMPWYWEEIFSKLFSWAYLLLVIG
jgi:hypothetical protein